MVTLYTLPNCTICHMVSVKLNEKNIKFQEKKFEEIAQKINSDHAPALQVNDKIYNTPSEIVQWIKQYGGESNEYSS